MSLSPPEAVYRYFYERRKKQAESRRVRLDGVSVVSVGNLTTGGTGKTPTVQWLVGCCAKADIPVAIVARGYGGRLSEQGAIVSDGEQVFFNADQAGDEALLHARQLTGVPVVIGKNRESACRLALEKFSPRVIVLDDGFQFWSLHRDFDLVLMDARGPFDNGRLLPLGRLREPRLALQRADAILLTRADRCNEEEINNSTFAIGQYTHAPLFQASHRPVNLVDVGSGQCHELAELRGLKVAALSALADNTGFFESLKAHGAQLLETVAKRDHHAWTEQEVAAFAAHANERGAASILTTAKDAVKMEAAWTAPLPLYSLAIEMSIDFADELWQTISTRLSL